MLTSSRFLAVSLSTRQVPSRASYLMRSDAGGNERAWAASSHLKRAAHALRAYHFDLDTASVDRRSSSGAASSLMKSRPVAEEECARVRERERRRELRVEVAKVKLAGLLRAGWGESELEQCPDERAQE